MAGMQGMAEEICNLLWKTYTINQLSMRHLITPQHELHFTPQSFKMLAMDGVFSVAHSSVHPLTRKYLSNNNLYRP